MQPKRVEDWLKNIYETQEEEISCTECFELVSRYVEFEASGQDAATKLPMVNQHLGQCRACRDEYEALRDLRSMEDQGEMPSVDDLKDSL